MFQCIPFSQQIECCHYQFGKEIVLFTCTFCYICLNYIGHPSTSLDDSLTNMQWLCKLDSNPLLETQQTNDTTAAEPMSMNPHPKPPYSYATLILLAINSTQEKRMTLQDIYKWIEDNFPYYKNCKKAWKVTIHAL